MRILFSFFFSIVLFAGEIDLPQPYKMLVEELSPKGVSLQITQWGGTFKAVIKGYTGGGFFRIDVTDDDFLSFYAQLYETLTNFKPKEVSIYLRVNDQRLPYNPFLQIWDGKNRIRLLKLSRLRQGCKNEVIGLTVKKVSGAKVWVDFGEIKEKLFESGFKFPVYYCFQ
ncbi:MAG TPA: hypothetical protein EYH48_01575 [Aquifex aeolicus]|uniref:Uncharacterized protein n=1 Tax=Aquifex aeolicus TaxID=63363 RepID=A0A9D0YQJ6_AQUAO|nr:hypothetical protein [Aquificales bacterium]HIP98134.1 hypothetical protein [Aquifex aeolicus]HIQ26014.1 hypothetical protein [Aquifex aeolicus]